uniref:Uncharacterized protein n=2 Tax=Aegilops tauschii subsp. strangulata TaxID=200361 RepID=A0A452XQN0_AEGTS
MMALTAWDADGHEDCDTHPRILLHRFKWRLPVGMQPCDVDVRDRYRTSHNMVTPLKAVPLPLFQLLLAEVISLSENYLGCFPIRRLKCKTRWILRHS